MSEEEFDLHEFERSFEKFGESVIKWTFSNEEYEMREIDVIKAIKANFPTYKEFNKKNTLDTLRQFILIGLKFDEADMDYFQNSVCDSSEDKISIYQFNNPLELYKRCMKFLQFDRSDNEKALTDINAFQKKLAQLRPPILMS